MKKLIGLVLELAAVAIGIRGAARLAAQDLPPMNKSDLSSEFGKTPSIRNGVQRCENLLNSLGLNYASPSNR